MNLEKVLIAPIITEKSQALIDIGKLTGKRTNKYVFKVHPEANKPLIKAAIKKIYQLTPTSINIIVQRGKIKRFRNLPSQRPHWKKAIVTFREGAALEFAKGV
jgi:large subunit ribosomal protein L23